MSLTRFELAEAQAAFESIYSRREGARVNFAYVLTDLAARFDELFSCVPLRVVLGVRAAIWLAAVAPLFVLGRRVTLARLPAPDRERVVAALLASPNYFVRQLCMLLKAFGALFAFRDVLVRDAVLRRGESVAQLFVTKNGVTHVRVH